MTDDRSKKHVSDETVSRWLRELPDAKADSAFRDHLRSSFVSGDIERAAAAAPDVDVTPTRPARAPSRPALWRWLVPAGVAIAALAVVLLNPGPALEVIDITGSGGIVVDGTHYDGSEAFSTTLDAGAVVEVAAGSTLDMAAAGNALYELTGGTRMTMPASAGRWWHRAVECSLFVGEMRFKSGPQFAGSELRVYTPDGMVVVTGTLLSVQADDNGTCVCLMEGTARVGVDASDLEDVTPGFRKIMMRDGRKEIIPVKPMHRDGVLDFDARVGDSME